MASLPAAGAVRVRPPGRILAVVGFGSFIAAKDLTVVSTMLRPIIGDLGITLPDGLDQAAWLVNAHLIAFVAVMPLAGKVSDVVGRRRVFLTALALFATGSAVIPLAHSLGLFLVGRVLTALGGGALVPVGLALVADRYVEGERARALGVLGAIETMGWVWGPIYGAALVRFLAWRWQFWLDLPLAAAAMAAGWRLLPADRPVAAVAAVAADDGAPARSSGPRVDWLSALALVAGLVSVNLALLGRAQIQSVVGLDGLGDQGGFAGPWLFGVAAAAFALFVVRERRAAEPLIDAALFRGRNLRAAVAVNFLLGGALVIAMVQVPLWINVVAVDEARSAVLAAQVLTALTAAIAVASYFGGRLTARWWYRPPTLIGLVLCVIGFALMGATWTPSTGFALMALHLAVAGAGLGLVIAPTSAAVVDHAPAHQRGTAAGLVLLLRLMGLSVGLSSLTAWGVRRFNQLRGTVTLPPLTDPGFKAALQAAQASITTSAIAEMFSATAVVMVVALGVGLLMRRSAATPASPTVHPVGPDPAGGPT